MKRAYLFLSVTTYVIVSCEPPKISNDIIWYPVDGEDGVFISTYGEKYKSDWRSDREAKYRVIQSLLNDPFEFSNSNVPFKSRKRRRSKRQTFFGNFIPQQLSDYPANDISNYPFFNFQNNQAQSQSHNFVNGRPIQGPFNTVNNNVHFFENEILGNGQTSSTHFNQQPSVNKWNGGGHNEFSEPFSGWQNTPNNFNVFNPSDRPKNYPFDSNIVGNQFGRPNVHPRPTDFNTKPNQSLFSSGLTRPNFKRPNHDDKLIFPGEDNSKGTTTSPDEAEDFEKVDEATQCERMCLVTPQFNPVCGSDRNTYSNMGRLKCAQKCGKRVTLAHYGNCRSSRLAIPPNFLQPKTSFEFLHI